MQDSFGELTLNYDEHQAYINNEEISLTALEFKLLKHLIIERAGVQTRDQFLRMFGVIVLMLQLEQSILISNV
jgi:DNA-binding response OmpR family regulator